MNNTVTERILYFLETSNDEFKLVIAFKMDV